MPPIKAAIDNPTLAKIFTTSTVYWWFSSKLVESSANADMVVNEPQKPIAANKEYFPSRCHCWDNTMKSPSMNEPITLTIKTLSGIAWKSNGDSVISYISNKLQVQNLYQEK